MKVISPASIDYAKDALPPILKGQATVFGNRVVLWEWNPQKRKYDQVDVLTGATTTERGDNLVAAGASKLLGEDSGFSGDESLVTVTITPTGAGCEDC